MNVILGITEIILFPEKSDSSVIIFLRGHDIDMDGSTCSFGDILHIIEEALEDIEVSGLSNVVHSLGIVGAESCSHTARKKERGNLALLYGIKSYSLKL